MTAQDQIALTNGNWRPVGGIVRWFPTLTAVPSDPPSIDDIACHRCGASMTQTCRSKSGWRTKDHAGRMPRLCPCGSEVEWKRRLCDECRRANDLEAKRATRLRKKAAA